jgi:hypothetical protein
MSAAPEPVRIAMWSGPRNISTAMMRSFGNRPDTAVIDEPFYAAYLAATGINHPLRAETLASQTQDWHDVVKLLLGPVPDGRAIFYQKHMTHHMLADFGRSWMAKCLNAFLIRDPIAVLRSYRARRDAVTLEDIGIVQQAALFDAVCDRAGAAPPVIHAADVLADPPGALQTLCTALNISFSPSMLRWPAGTRATDGAWAPAWYQSVEKSTGFEANTSEATAPLDAGLRRLADAAQPFYDRLEKYRIAAPKPG